MQYDFPGLKTEGGIAFTEGGYASKGARAARGAWFRDSEGTVLMVATARYQWARWCEASSAPARDAGAA